jgi:hypothetical protein
MLRMHGCNRPLVRVTYLELGPGFYYLTNYLLGYPWDLWPGNITFASSWISWEESTGNSTLYSLGFPLEEYMANQPF